MVKGHWNDEMVQRKEYPSTWMDCCCWCLARSWMSLDGDSVWVQLDGGSLMRS